MPIVPRFTSEPSTTVRTIRMSDDELQTAIQSRATNVEEGSFRIAEPTGEHRDQPESELLATHTEEKTAQKESSHTQNAREPGSDDDQPRQTGPIGPHEMSLAATEDGWVWVWFPRPPGPHVTQSLRNHGFRWDSPSRAWYARHDIETEKTIDSLSHATADASRY